MYFPEVLKDSPFKQILRILELKRPGWNFWVENIWQPCIREVPFGASVTAFNTFEEMSNNTASIKALLQQMIIETSLMLAQPLCNETIVSLMANQGKDPAAAFNNLPGRHRQ